MSKQTKSLSKVSDDSKFLKPPPSKRNTTAMTNPKPLKLPQVKSIKPNILSTTKKVCTIGTQVKIDNIGSQQDILITNPRFVSFLLCFENSIFLE
jgi:hypothetical protein